MAQDISKLSNGGKSAPEKKQVAKIDAHAHKKLLWSSISKKFLLPASILFLAAGLFLVVFFTLQMLQIVPQAETMTLGMQISNIVLGVFNLLPIPPLDGGRIAVGFLPVKLARPLARLEPYGILIVIGILLGLHEFFG